MRARRLTRRSYRRAASCAPSVHGIVQLNRRQSILTRLTGKASYRGPSFQQPPFRFPPDPGHSGAVERVTGADRQLAPQSQSFRSPSVTPGNGHSFIDGGNGRKRPTSGHHPIDPSHVMAPKTKRAEAKQSAASLLPNAISAKLTATNI
jgi:hypothetical protein